ncbi:MAG: hypothetical protein JO257_36195 [Deltaproteobacteria bacterium]|nr:hypothetical protein [Deltaproteobacteria bacterium]
MTKLLWAAAALCAGCGTNSTTGGGTVQVVLDIPNATLDPKGYSSVELRLHGADGDLERNVPVFNGMFDLGDLQTMHQVTVDAVLRTDTGEAVGYGRSSTPMDVVAGAMLTVPVRRPIVYFAGLVSQTNPNTMVTTWSEAPATFGDMSAGTTFNGSTTLSGNTVLMVSAGPSLFEVQQPVKSSDGTPQGSATIVPVSTGDHSLGTPLAGTLDGGVIDGAGTDDGKLLVIGTSQHLYLVDTMTGTARSMADGQFDRVALVTSSTGQLSALAVKNRGSTTSTCSSTAELVWVTINGDETSNVNSLGAGGWADVAGDRGHAYYVDQCKGELGEATMSGVMSKRTMLGRATMLAVSGQQAWIGVEKPGRPAQLALVSASIAGSDPPRTLYSVPVVQVVEATDYPGVQRSFDADTAVFNQLEVGAGGDYVATTTTAHFQGNAITSANFPEMEIVADELRVVDAASGAAVQRYRSWCDGTITLQRINDIQNWGCATETGQSAPATMNLEHKLGSMTFTFGKK